MFKKVLVANRGEIALRIIRTLKDMGIRSVAVYSDADKGSLAVRCADQAIHVGPALARKSYLDIEKMVDAAKSAGVDALHPGYGFLAENARFAKACEDNGIQFIGPSWQAQELAGEKIESIKVAKEAGVAVAPGSEGAVSSLDEACSIAERIKYPVIIKASGGGGGKGMRIAYDDRELMQFIKLSAGEARAAFGNPNIYIEKYILKPRHIEFQILADKFGNCIHLGERECSIQRNYQKLIEESPSPFVDDEMRENMGLAAIKVMQAVSYTNAGTVEFLVDEDRRYYFNEINSRLQVEHPVTEMVTGIDLVREQILIAAGKPLEIKGEDIRRDGWSMECRINAEDPDKNFQPAPGFVRQLILPGGFGVRVDTHLYSGYEIPPFYDSLIAKLVVWGRDRQSAIARMSRALDELAIDGIKTTIPLHRKIMKNVDFINGEINTEFLERFFRKD
jgi:acetyl-CoA carboxylase biotin carboxylase subunit